MSDRVKGGGGEELGRVDAKAGVSENKSFGLAVLLATRRLPFDHIAAPREKDATCLPR